MIHLPNLWVSWITMGVLDYSSYLIYGCPELLSELLR